VPDRQGLYAWYCDYRLVPDAQPRLPDPIGWNLLYVGIAPSRSTSKATLRSRVLGQHLGGNVGSSTFRLSLAALLWEGEGWVPERAGSRAQLSRADNGSLSAWQERHLALSWAEHP